MIRQKITKPAKHKSISGFVEIVVIFIAVVVLGIVGYLVFNKEVSTPNEKEGSEQTTSKPTMPDMETDISEWETYKNNTYGYKIHYPSNWEIIEAKSANTPNWPYDKLQEDQLHQVRFSEKGLNNQGNFTISVNKNRNNLNTQEWRDNYFVPLASDPDTNLATPKGKILIANRDAYKFSVFAFDGYITEIGLINNGNLYLFSFTEDTPNDPNIKEHKAIYNQILSTFEFLDNAEGKFCGGIAANLPQNKCPEGYRCKLDGNYTDAGGVCVKD